MTETEEITTKEGLLRRIELERAALEESVEGLDEAQMRAPVFDGGWSVKDTLAHITAWEQLMIEMVAHRMRDERLDLGVSGDDWVDQLNARFYEENRDRSLAEVREQFRRSGEEAYQTAASLSEEELFDPELYPWRDGSPIFTLVAANTCWHYQDHRETIERWLETEPD